MGDRNDAENAFYFLYGYYNQAQGKQLTPGQRASIEEIDEIEMQAKIALADEGDEVQWQLCVATILQFHDHFDVAISKYTQILDTKPEIWVAQQRLAEVLGLIGQYSDAILTAQALIEQEKLRLDSDSEYTYEYWQHILPSIAGWHLRTCDEYNLYLRQYDVT